MNFYLVEALTAIPLWVLLTLFSYRMLRVERRALLMIMMVAGDIAIEIGFDMFGKYLGAAENFLRLPTPFLLTFVSLSVCSNERTMRRILCSVILMMTLMTCDMLYALLSSFLIGEKATFQSRADNIPFFAIARMMALPLVTVILIIALRFWDRSVKRAKDKTLSWFFLFPLNLWIFLAFIYVIINNYELHPGVLFVFFLLTITSLLITAVMFLIIRQLNQKEMLEMQNVMLAQRIDVQNEQYEHIMFDIERANSIRHDMRNQIAAAFVLMERGDIELARKQIAGYSEKLTQRAGVYCENRVADAVITSKHLLCEKRNITLSCAVNIPENISIEGTALCSLLCNVLDNAIAACEKLPDDIERIINLSAGLKSGFLIVKQENATPDVPPLTASDAGKLSQHGLGLLIIKRIAEEYGGKVDIAIEEGTFKIVIWLALRQEADAHDQYCHM